MVVERQPVNLTLPAKKVSLAECSNSRKESGANSLSMNPKGFMADLNLQTLPILMKNHCAELARSVKQ
jgi:hypothetical protein